MRQGGEPEFIQEVLEGANQRSGDSAISQADLNQHDGTTQSTFEMQESFKQLASSSSIAKNNTTGRNLLDQHPGVGGIVAAKLSFDQGESQQLSSFADGQVASQEFLERRSQAMVRNKHETSMALKNSRMRQKDGYDAIRIQYPPIDELNEDFLCAICQKIVNTPVECENYECGQLYCTYCLSQHSQGGGVVSCQVCKTAEFGYRNPSPMIQKLLFAYSIRCSTCNKPFSLKDLPKHEIICQQSVCSNELCGIPLRSDAFPQQELEGFGKVKYFIMGEEFVSCSKKCKKVTKFAYMLRQNNEQEILRAFESMLRKKLKKSQQQNASASQNQKSRLHQAKQMVGGQAQSMPMTKSNAQILQRSRTNQSESSQRLNATDTHRMENLRCNTQRLGSTIKEEEGKEKEGVTFRDNSQGRVEMKYFSFLPDIHEFCWDADNSSREINFSSDYRHAFLHETNYLFRTMISSRPFMDGVHYWEIIADARTEHELKIGVTLQQKFNTSNSFCDYDFGYGFYGLGELRHGSNANGVKYGKFFKKKGILGVLLDMDKGTLSFAMDGEFFGQAFQDEKLRRGPIWAAISLLHTGGCTLVSGLEKPSYFV